MAASVAACRILTAAHTLSSFGMWNLSSQTRDWTHIPCITRQILHHWIIRDVPNSLQFLFSVTFWYFLIIYIKVAHRQHLLFCEIHPWKGIIYSSLNYALITMDSQRVRHDWATYTFSWVLHSNSLLVFILANEDNYNDLPFSYFLTCWKDILCTIFRNSEPV